MRETLAEQCVLFVYTHLDRRGDTPHRSDKVLFLQGNGHFIFCECLSKYTLNERLWTTCGMITSVVTKMENYEQRKVSRWK